MQQQHDCAVARPFVDVVHAHAGDLDIMRREVEIGQVAKAVVRRTDDVGHSNFLLIPARIPLQ